jgi:uncharacterized protein (TIGR02996 family)
MHDAAALALQAEVAGAPDDVAPQLVLADLLLSAGDPRGELIVLDARERSEPGGIADPVALEHYLLLAAEYSFPRAAPDLPPLAFQGTSAPAVAYVLEHAGRVYIVRYTGGVMEIDVAGRTLATWRLRLASRATWTADETVVILRLLGDAIRAGTPLDRLRFPFMRDPLPVYDGGPLRGYELPRAFNEARGLRRNRYGLAPRDYARWLALFARQNSAIARGR